MVDAQTMLKLKKKYPTEQVFIIPFQRSLEVPDGFTPQIMTTQEELKMLITWEKDGKFVARYDAEENEAFCQLIPYTFILSKDHKKVYTAKRLAGDDRLKSQYSLGFGGHINPGDLSYVVRSAEWRELEEECNLVEASSSKFVGFVRELNSSTKEHLGFVYYIDVDDASINESDTLKGQWMDIADLVDNYYRFEGWSKLIIDYMLTTTVDDKLWE